MKQDWFSFSATLVPTGAGFSVHHNEITSEWETRIKLNATELCRIKFAPHSRKGSSEVQEEKEESMGLD